MNGIVRIDIQRHGNCTNLNFGSTCHAIDVGGSISAVASADGDGSDAGEDDDSNRNRRGYEIEKRVLWVVGGGKQEILGWEQAGRKCLSDIDPALFVRRGHDVKGGKAETERQ